jgi:hypothetical protein
MLGLHVYIAVDGPQAEYKDGTRSLCDNGFRKIEFVGMCPIVNFKTETAIFYKDGNVLGI